MRLTFRLRFHTEYGQALFVAGNHPILGSGQAETAIPLHYLNDQYWQGTVELAEQARPDAPISYRYILRLRDGSIIEDWGAGRSINPGAVRAGDMLIVDAWNDPGAVENIFYTEPFQQVLLRADRPEFAASAPATPTHIIRAKAPRLASGQTLCLLGNSAALGRWSTDNPLLLKRPPGESYFSVALDLAGETVPISYKYGVYDVAGKAFVRYEDGDNRVLNEPARPNNLIIVNDGFVALPTAAWKGAGVAIPVFSLRSERSFGIGQFSDLKPLVDWCIRTGLKLIQILPANDTTANHSWQDSYPYSAISAFALHPLYIDLDRVATRQNRKLIGAAESERLRLNSLDAVDYEGVLKAKIPLLKQLYALQREKTFKQPDYQEFFELNRHWLVAYAVFCALRDLYGTADFNHWPAHHRYQSNEVAALQSKPEIADSMGFNYFVQYHLHLQLREAAEYAHAHGVILKGDLPIGVYRNGADAWQEPEQYHMEMQAGAPPDPFSAKGQNWSFPTYNWPAMKATGFAWWKARFEQMGRYFDAFRIDHILGFFRIWSIPINAVEGILGYFVPALPVRISEFGARGIRFDHSRYSKPYITDPVLREIFGADQERVKQQFLRQDGHGLFSLKPEYSTQRQVEEHFAKEPNNAANQKLKIGLYDLISNMILLAAADTHGQQFHFRFDIENTPSFRHLDGGTRAKLKELYVDYFYRRQDEFWRKEGLQKLPALKRVTNMLVCGEDLGMVPACVPEVMKQLGLLSLEVQRMPKRLGQNFSRPSDAPYLSVVTPSTHDMSTIRGWWMEDRHVTQRFYNHELGKPGGAPIDCEPWINKAVVVQHLASTAMWSIFQLQDLLGMNAALRRANPDDERINVPAIPNFYWRYRMHLSLESLLAAEDFNRELKQMVSEYGR